MHWSSIVNYVLLANSGEPATWPFTISQQPWNWRVLHVNLNKYLGLRPWYCFWTVQASSLSLSEPQHLVDPLQCSSTVTIVNDRIYSNMFISNILTCLLHSKRFDRSGFVTIHKPSTHNLTNFFISLTLNLHSRHVSFRCCDVFQLMRVVEVEVSKNLK